MEKAKREKMQVRETLCFVNDLWLRRVEKYRKVGSLKRRVWSRLAKWKMKSCTQLWHEANFEVKRVKAHHVRTTFGRWYVEKMHAVVVRSTCGNEHIQNKPVSNHFWKLRCGKKCMPLWHEARFGSKTYKNTPCSDHFWTLRCGKSVRRCGVKHVWEWACTTHTRFGALLEVEKWKKCPPLWRKTHFWLNLWNYHTFGSLLDVQLSSRCRKVHAGVTWSTLASKKSQKL